VERDFTRIAQVHLNRRMPLDLKALPLRPASALKKKARYLQSGNGQKK
jgi:hypothetical protein